MTQTALITGASSGIGYELAKLFAADQYNLVLVARSEQKLNELKAQIHASHSAQVMVLPMDLSVPTAPQDLFNAVAQQGMSIDVLVNNAGFGDYGFFVDSNWDRQAQMLQLNIVTLTHLTRLFLPGMVQRKSGRILNLASTASFQPGPLMSVYFATKAYVLSFTEAIANELIGTGVTATALCPGPTESGFQSAASVDDSKMFNHTLPTSAEVAQFGYRALHQGKTVVVHGAKNSLLAFLGRFVPRNVLTASVRSMLKSNTA